MTAMDHVTLQFHPLAEWFPLLTGKAFAELVTSIRAIGLKHAITTLCPKEASELIDILRERIPRRPKPAPRRKAEPTSHDPNYEQWLKD